MLRSEHINKTDDTKFYNTPESAVWYIDELETISAIATCRYNISFGLPINAILLANLPKGRVTFT